MAIPTVTVGGKVTAVETNQIVGAVNGTALSGIIPTSVVGGTATLLGSVTFTNASTVSLNGVFSGTFDNYRITYNSPTRSASASTQFRLRQAGVDITSSTYDYVKTYSSGTTNTVASSSSGTAFPLDQAVGVGQVTSGVFDIFGPALGGFPTLGQSSASVLFASALTTVHVGFANESTSASDGFSMYPLSGTWSGTIRVYGYNNLT